MPIEVATHSGSFHADDVLAFALIRVFVDADATIVRTRDLERIAEADIAVDVGGEFDAERCRFDHHQASYEGTRSSAGMVLDWLEAEGKVRPAVAGALRDELVDNVDAVDIGAHTPVRGIPCFSTLVGIHNNTAETPEDFLENFLAASAMAERVVAGVRHGVERAIESRAAVIAAMQDAEEVGRAVLFLDQYGPWKGAYFGNGGADHPTDYVLFPGDGKWRVVAIPPRPDSFDKKRPLPAEWAGLVDEELAEVVGVDGAVFCHKNRFIAVFETRDQALEALEKWGLMRRPA